MRSAICSASLGRVWRAMISGPMLSMNSWSMRSFLASKALRRSDCLVTFFGGGPICFLGRVIPADAVERIGMESTGIVNDTMSSSVN